MSSGTASPQQVRTAGLECRDAVAGAGRLRAGAVVDDSAVRFDWVLLSDACRSTIAVPDIRSGVFSGGERNIRLLVCVRLVRLR